MRSSGSGASDGPSETARIVKPRTLPIAASARATGPVPITTSSGRALHPGTVSPGVNGRTSTRIRSEEQTSELQSRFDLVCRLLLEKKKKLFNNVTAGMKKVYVDLNSVYVNVW